MNILIANWAWYPSGGDWTYIESISSLYEQRGHQVIPFSMKDERNFPTPYSEYFIDNIDYKKLNRAGDPAAAITVLRKSIYSAEATGKLEKLLATVKIDLAHLNLIHHYLTPAILTVLKRHGIPVIWTLHDYTILCPQSTFISNDRVCEECLGGKFYRCVVNRCKKGSIAASTVAALENYTHSFLNYYRYVDYYICPSRFSYEKYKAAGFFPGRLRHIYHTYALNFNSLEGSISAAEKRYIVFVGRLEKIKGVRTLLSAMKDNPEIELKIIGDGSEEQELKRYAEANQINNIQFLGKLPKQQVLEILSLSAFMVCPSEWYEVLGLTIYEAMLMEKPVIGSRIGAIPETVIDGHTGFLFEPGNAAELSQKIRTLYYSDNLAQMGLNARKHISSIVDPDSHFEALKAIIPEL